ncbi:MAG: sigma-70 family RNA polymerase sigma factor [Actinomycetota bacterium]|uniref:sigma-70 family RNA polymerase sigma factor n=1 Tax=Mycobacterium sp. G7A2 TaxID=3317307 RepID=UPI002EB1920B|nr:sigma-70 family RNA polymerase sigma factor [Actinomycetota bacterium]
MTTMRLAHDDDLTTRFARDAVPAIDGLYRHAFTLTRNHADAEDLLQDTAARAYASFGSFQRGTNLSGWLYRIMVNTHRNNHRRQQHRPTLWLTDEFSDPQLLTHARRTAGPGSAEDEVLARAGDQRVAAAMRGLPATYRTAVYHADVEGRTYKEIAALTEVPLGTVMSRVHRGRIRLRRALAERAAA